MKKLSQILLFSFLSLIVFAETAKANSTVDARAIVVKGLEGFKGKRLSVYYVSARPATLETPGQIARVRKILKGPLAFVINDRGEVQIPATSVQRDGWTNFNHLIFVIHAQSKHALRNVDGTVPEALDRENAVPFKTEYAQFLFRKSLEYKSIIENDGEISLY